MLSNGHKLINLYECWKRNDHVFAAECQRPDPFQAREFDSVESRGLDHKLSRDLLTVLDLLNIHGVLYGVCPDADLPIC
jgi:hypothetical protein